MRATREGPQVVNQLKERHTVLHGLVFVSQFVAETSSTAEFTSCLLNVNLLRDDKPEPLPRLKPQLMKLGLERNVNDSTSSMLDEDAMHNFVWTLKKEPVYIYIYLLCNFIIIIYCFCLFIIIYYFIIIICHCIVIICYCIVYSISYY